MKIFDHPVQLFYADGAILVAMAHRVGRLTAEGVDWIGNIPKRSPGLGKNIINRAGGFYPEPIYAMYSSDNGRAPAPAFFPMTGGGMPSGFSPGGGMGFINGAARVGDTIMVSGYSNYEGGYTLLSAVGPKLPLEYTTAKSHGCTEKEVPRPMLDSPPPAVNHNDLGSTKQGTMLAFGSLCYTRGNAVEVWPAGANGSRIVDVSKWVKGETYRARIFRAPGEDRAWISGNGTSPVLEYRAGEITALPTLKRGRKDTFLSQEKELYANDGQALYRLDENAASKPEWKLVAHLDWETDFDSIQASQGVFWGTKHGKLYKLSPGKSLAHDEGCETPFVFLYDISPKALPKYTFPTTRKALKSFDGVGDISLVEFNEHGRRLGLKVPSAAVGERVIAHVRATMKDEQPKLLCYTPENPRVIEIAK